MLVTQVMSIQVQDDNGVFKLRMTTNSIKPEVFSSETYESYEEAIDDIPFFLLKYSPPVWKKEEPAPKPKPSLTMRL